MFHGPGQVKRRVAAEERDPASGWLCHESPDRARPLVHQGCYCGQGIGDDLLRSLVRQVSLEHFGYGLLSSGTYTQQAIPRI
jgi:hypothetical protein